MKTDLKQITESKKIKILIVSIILSAILFGAFQAGVFIGFHKASFLFKSGDNFYKSFGERNDKVVDSMSIGGRMFKDEFSGGHGAVGKIIKVNLPNIILIGPDNIEKIIVVSENTSIRYGRQTSSINSLNTDQNISVLGTPDNEGRIIAKYIRIVQNTNKRLLTSPTSTIKSM